MTDTCSFVADSIRQQTASGVGIGLCIGTSQRMDRPHLWLQTGTFMCLIVCGSFDDETNDDR